MEVSFVRFQWMSHIHPKTDDPNRRMDAMMFETRPDARTAAAMARAHAARGAAFKSLFRGLFGR